MSEVVELKTTKPDKDRAEEIRRALDAPVAQVVAIMNDAARDGIIVGLNIGRDDFGRFRLVSINIVRPL